MIIGMMAAQARLLVSNPPPTTPPQWITKSAFVASAGLATVGWPAGGTYAVGDLAILYVTTPNQPISVGSGWTLIGGVSTGTAGAASAGRIFAWWRIVDGTEAPFSAGNAANSYTAAIIHIFRGAHATTPIDAYTTAVEPAVNNPTIAGVTSTVDNCLIAACYSLTTDISGSGTSAWGNSSMVSVTERSDDITSTGSGGGIAVATGALTAAGSSGITSLTSTYADAAVSITIAIAPL